MTSTTSHNVGGGGDYIYRTQTQLPPVFVQVPANPCTITPPESCASGTRDPGHVDIGRLSDVDGDYKDVTLLEETPPRGTAPVRMVHVSPNKVTLCEGDGTRVSKSPPVASQMFLKDSMKDIFVNISTEGNVPELLVLHGANGGVVIHKGIIAAYSKLVREQLAEFPDCTTIYLPNYSQKILRKVVEILYTGETFYSEEEKKDVNLIWEAMRQLQISFNDKSFFYHPVEYTAVKEEEEGESSNQNEEQATTSTNEVTNSIPVEVDQTEETWYDDQTNNQNAFAYCRVVRRPHPENPSKSVTVHSQYGEGRKIQRSMPAHAHVNADTIKEKERVENQKEVEIILSKHKPIFIDLDDDDNKIDNHPTPSKKKRTETFAASTTVYTDEEFKKLVASGAISINIVKAATEGLVGNEQTQLHPVINELVAPSSQQQHQPLVMVAPRDATGVDTGRVVIPPNRPEGISITVVGQKSPMDSTDSQHNEPSTSASSSPSSSLEMPTLQPAVVTAEGTRKQRTRQASADITDISIPRLDRVENYMKNIEAVSNGQLPSVTPAAAVIPVKKVNRFLRTNQQQPVPKSSVATNAAEEPIPSTSAEAFGRPMRKRNCKTLDFPSRITDEELNRMREAHFKKQEQDRQKLKNKEIVVASLKKPVPGGLAVDTYVEDLNEEIDQGEIEGILDRVDMSFLPAISGQKQRNEMNPGVAPQAGTSTGKRGRGARRGNSRLNSPTKSTQVEDKSQRGAKRGRGGRRGGGRGRGETNA